MRRPDTACGILPQGPRAGCKGRGAAIREALQSYGTAHLLWRVRIRGHRPCVRSPAPSHPSCYDPLPGIRQGRAMDYRQRIRIEPGKGGSRPRVGDMGVAFPNAGIDVGNLPFPGSNSMGLENHAQPQRTRFVAGARHGISHASLILPGGYPTP